MMRGPMKRFDSWGLRLAAFVALAPLPALAVDPQTPSGFYFGGHVGYLFGTGTATLGDPAGVASSDGSNTIGQLFGGVQGGWQTLFEKNKGFISNPNLILVGQKIATK